MGAHGASEDSPGSIANSRPGLHQEAREGRETACRALRGPLHLRLQGSKPRSPPTLARPHPHNLAPGASSPPQAVVPSFVRRWVYSLPELIQAKEAGEFQAREEALRAEAEAEARAVAAAAEARPGGPRRGRKRKRR